MSTAYVECPHCGGRALSVATRCPHCGFDFPPRPLDRSAGRPDRGRLRLLLAVLGVLVVGAVLVTVTTRRTAPKAGVTAPVAAPADTASADTAVATASPATAEPRDSAPASPAPEPPSRPEARAPAVQGVQRYARTWTNVRSGRGGSAPAVAILNPGDAVLVDSLRRGWYRVLVDGRAMGYVHRSTLGVEPPAGTPGPAPRQSPSR